MARSPRATDRFEFEFFGKSYSMAVFARRQFCAWSNGASRIWKDICFISRSDVKGCETGAITDRWHQVYEICSNTKQLPGIANHDD